MSTDWGLLRKYSGPAPAKPLPKGDPYAVSTIINEPKRKKRPPRDLNAKVRTKPRSELSVDRRNVVEKAYDAFERNVSRQAGGDLRTALELVYGPSEMVDITRRILSGDAGAADYGVAGLSVAPLPKPVRKAATKLASRAADSRLGRALLTSEPVPEPRPRYIRTQDGDHLTVAREGLEPAVVPEAADARNISELRTLIRDYSSNPARRMADEAASEAGLGPVDYAVRPQSSLGRQAGIGRAYRAAVEDTPGYQSAVFDRIGEMMPEVVERSGAQNYNQLTEAAYKALGDEVKAQFDRLPVRTTYHSGDLEYPVPSAMMRDALGGNLNVFRGGDPHEFLDEVDPQTGLTLNEMFRAVHDYVGHVAPGSTFRPDGEEIAYAVHAQTMSPLARMALLSETRGQNSLVNYSPLNADLVDRMMQARRQLRERDAARKLQGNLFSDVRERGLRALEQIPSDDTLKSQLRELGGRWRYADQRAVLLPPEYLDPMSSGGTPEWLRGLLKPEGTSARGVHISRAEGLNATDPSFYGRGHVGAEYAGVRAAGGPDRTYFYSGPEGTVEPELSVMGRDAPRFAYEADLGGLYDLQADPEGLLKLAEAYNQPGYKPKLGYNDLYAVGMRDLEGSSALNDMESLVRDYGYKGYIVDRPGYDGQRWAALYDPVEGLRSIERGAQGYYRGGLVE